MSVLDNKKISFIGGGNMAQALISGLVSCGIKPSLITVADPSGDIREQLAAKGLNTVDPMADAKSAVIGADIVVLAVKPQIMKVVVGAFADALDNQLVISVLVMWVDDEEHMHAVTAVSGSAPAYMFYFIESMVDGAVALGLDKEQASALAMQTMLGAAKMAMNSEDAPAELRRKVTSPNGTTQAAVESMQANEIGRQIGEAMQACYDRSQALSEEMSK